MFNTKNIIILCISAVIAAFITPTITQFTALAGFTAFLLNGFLALILMLALQSIKTEKMTKYFAERKAAKAASKKSQQSVI